MQGTCRLCGSLLAAVTLAAAASAQAAPTVAVPGGLSPGRDLRGTWASPLSGKGYQLTGRLVQGPATGALSEHGDIRLQITKVVAEKVGVTTDYKAYGTMTFSKLVLTETVTVATAKGLKTSPPQTIVQGGATAKSRVVLSVSGTRLHVAFIAPWARAVTMQGTFTSDLMRGTLTKQYAGPGAKTTLSGQFQLVRAR